MIIWMLKESAYIKGNIQRKVSQSAATELAVLAFVSVFREGIETMLFLGAKVTSVFLVLFAAGLTAQEHVWDMNGILDENGTGNPSLLELLSYAGYYVLGFYRNIIKSDYSKSAASIKPLTE